MRKIVYLGLNLTLSSFISVGALRSDPPQNTNYRRLILISDVDKNSDAMLSNLLMAGVSQSAPIVLTADLFNQFINKKISALDSVNTHPIFPKEAKNIESIANAPTKAALEQFQPPFLPKLLILYQFLFLDNDWYFFDIPGTSLLLLIPKKYLNKLTGSSQLENPRKVEETLGFFLDGTQIPLPNQNITQSDQLKAFEGKFLGFVQQKPKEFKAAHLKKLLKPTPFTKDGYTYCWNIFATGHGTAPEPIIIGLDSYEFEQTLGILNSYVHTNLFYYVTCYGGSEASLGKPYLKFKGFKDLNYIVASGATTDAPVFNAWLNPANKTYIVENAILVPEPMINFNEFFNLLEQQGTFEKALKAITAPLAKNIPLVRFPGTEVFSASKIDNSVAIITNVNNLAALIDNKEFNVQDKIALIVYPRVVPMNINFNNEKPIELIFMDPSSAHYFGYLKVKNINSLFYSGIHTKTASFHNVKYIYIDKLIFPSLFTSDNNEKKDINIKLEGAKQYDEKTDITNLFIKNNSIIFNNVIIQFGDPYGFLLMATRPAIYLKLPGAKAFEDRYFKGSYITPNFIFKELSDEDRDELRDIRMIEERAKNFKLAKQEKEERARTIRESGFLKRQPVFKKLM